MSTKNRPKMNQKLPNKQIFLFLIRQLPKNFRKTDNAAKNGLEKWCRNCEQQCRVRNLPILYMFTVEEVLKILLSCLYSSWYIRQVAVLLLCAFVKFRTTFSRNFTQKYKNMMNKLNSVLYYTHMNQ
jgi:hypothetical protein